MLNADAKQFRLMEDGQIFYQPIASNPMPGEAVARVRKGQSALSPEIDVLENDQTKALDDAAVKAKLQTWLAGYIKETLEPLVNLETLEEDLPGPVRGICFQVHESMGIVPRESLEDLIKDLDADMRQTLRQKNVRLGPILVFLPALNKPAGVRLRGLLWALWHEKPLPVEMPKDGIVSYAIDKKNVDRSFQQAIAYPVFGPRAIRIDMLDRVISAVYDSANEGKFQAQHKMAEWLGSSIEDLYEVLEAMGHRKVYDPVEAVAKAEAEAGAETSEAVNAEEVSAVEPAKEEESGEAAQVEAPKAEETKEAKEEQVKPELATFRLKKGKAFQKSAGQRRPHQGKDDKRKGKGKRNKQTNRTPKVMSAGPKKSLEDSPFAVLQQLKDKQSGS